MFGRLSSCPVAKDNGARRALILIENKRNLFDCPGGHPRRSTDFLRRFAQ